MYFYGTYRCWATVEPHTLSVVDQNSRFISIFWHQFQLLIHGYCLFVKHCFLKILFNPSLPDKWILKCESYHYFYINTCNHMLHTVVGQQYPHTLSVVDQLNTCDPMVHTVVGQQYPHTLSVVDQISRIISIFDINVNYWYMDIVFFCKTMFP